MFFIFPLMLLCNNVSPTWFAYNYYPSTVNTFADINNKQYSSKMWNTCERIWNTFYVKTGCFLLVETLELAIYLNIFHIVCKEINVLSVYKSRRVALSLWFLLVDHNTECCLTNWERPELLDLFLLLEGFSGVKTGNICCSGKPLIQTSSQSSAGN